jgi:CheY-like chemotaxis protein
MATDPQRHPCVLVIGDVEEIRDGIERLLRFSGYLVTTARDEAGAVVIAGSPPADLILISLGIDAAGAVVMAHRIRDAARLNHSVPVVVFCVPGLPEGAEEMIGDNIYLTRPDNFDQLRRLLKRLVAAQSPA